MNQHHTDKQAARGLPDTLQDRHAQRGAQGVPPAPPVPGPTSVLGAAPTAGPARIRSATGG